MAQKKPTGKAPQETSTTGHDWDGITELDTPMPRWWLWTFYFTIVWAIGYAIAYPAWPLLTGATPGMLGYSSRGEVAADIAQAVADRSGLDSRIVATDLAEIRNDPELLQYANSGGAAVFRTNCSQCHGDGAGGLQAAGYPNLLDDDWIWGGQVEDIHLTISHGIRWEDDPDTRFSQMPAFGEVLTPDEILSTASHVLKLSSQEHDAGLAAAGATLFTENCAACHGDDGAGMAELGAPNLTDAIWLYGGSEERIVETITNARFGIMPQWTSRLSEAEIRKVAVYVHQLGGGE